VEWLITAGLCLLAAQLGGAERINHEGRILGPVPVITNAILFNTPEADAVISGLQIFPRDNAWNEDISRRPLLSNSGAMINQIHTNLLSSRRTLRAFKEMNFVLVPNNQPMVPIDFTVYPGESDPSPYPVPSNMPVETWPSETGSLSLFDWQRDVNGVGGDRHSIIVQPDTGNVWETWQALLAVTAGATNWEAANGAKFSLTNNTLRPLGWTSADAAGLSMFGGLVRYDECERGMVEHAIRIIVRQTRNAYIYPASHRAGSTSNPDAPAMGQRLRLKSSFVIPETWTIQEKAILRALKKYGAIVADNGNFFSISVVPDQRWPANAFGHFSSVSVTNFEVIQSTGPNEGPRSPGAPIVNAGADQVVSLGATANLQGTSLYTNAAPIFTQWRLYSGPGAVTFGNANQTNTTASFTSPGTYTLMLSASNGVHTTAYDAVLVTVQDTIRVTISLSGPDLLLRWSGGRAPYQIERTSDLSSAQWSPVMTTSTTNLALPRPATTGYFRVRGQ
jgi:hypothetical protein